MVEFLEYVNGKGFMFAEFCREKKTVGKLHESNLKQLVCGYRIIQISEKRQRTKLALSHITSLFVQISIVK
jgi:hypothetical protein